MAYDYMYEELHTKEGQNKIYRLAKQREKNSRDINGAPKVIKNKDGKLIIKEKEIMNRWKEYFQELLNYIPHMLHLDEHSPCQNLIPPIIEQEIIICQAYEKNKARGPDDIPIESLKALGDDGIHFLRNVYNKILGNEEVPQKWRQSYLVLIFKNKGDPYNCQNYRGIKLMSHIYIYYKTYLIKEYSNS
ncbi:unnamed protein product [Gordionus sp. m RMFG-2023]